MNLFRTHWLWLCALAAVIVLTIVVFAPLTSHYAYPFDSADYMYAGQRGFWANYTDQGALGLDELLEKGPELIKNKEKRGEFSHEIRQRGDLGFYRHYHGPMFAYFIAAAQALGAEHEAAYRNAGFAVLAFTSLCLALAFWSLFPEWPPIIGFLAGAMLMINRTELITATEITQHLMFLMMAVLTLWAMGLFARTLDTRWWYVIAILVGLGFVAVETTILIVAALFVMLAILYRDILAKWTIRELTILLLKGIGLCVLTLFLAWPAGILKLGLARGFGYLAYMALDRKVFSPYGPLDTWIFQFRNAPYEHWLALAGFIATLVCWRKFRYRREAMPWILYALTYIVITTKVTQDFTHYRGTIAMAGVMMTAMAAAHFWGRWNAAGRAALVVVMLGAAVAQAEAYREYLGTREKPGHEYVLEYVRSKWLPAGSQSLYMPYYFIPILHYYYPEVKAVGYDVDWTMPRLLNALRQPDTASEFLCRQSICRAVAKATGMNPDQGKQVAPMHEREPLLAFPTPAH